MATSKSPQELRDRATRLAIEARRDPATRTGAINRVAEQTGIGKETLRNWVREAETREMPTEPVDAESQFSQLQKENRELRKSNDIFKSAAAYFGERDIHLSPDPRAPGVLTI